jgi:hypothetical protein
MFAYTAITQVTIPAAVTTIGPNVFKGTTSLNAVTLIGGLSQIGESMFEASAVESIIIPSSVTVIGANAFLNAAALGRIWIQGSATTWPSFPFTGTLAASVCGFYENTPIDCTYSTSTTSTTTTTPGQACARYGTWDDTTKQLVLLRNLTAGMPAVCKDTIVTLDIDPSVTVLPTSAFSGAALLQTVTIPGSIATVGIRAFYACGALTSVTIAQGVATISAQAFKDCAALAVITIDGTPTLASDAFTNALFLTYCDPPASQQSYMCTPPAPTNSPTTAPTAAPTNSPTTAPTAAPTNDPTTAPTAAPTNDPTTAPTNSPTTHPCMPYGTWDAATAHLTLEINMTTAMPDDCKHVIVSLYIASTVTVLPDRFMYNAPLLESVVIPGSLTTIGTETFMNSRTLHSVTLQPGLRQVGEYMFVSTLITSIVFPDSLETVEKFAFSDCYQLQSITFNSGLQTLQVAAFLACSSLGSIVLPESLTRIENAAFQTCSSLTTVTFNSALQHIGISGFSGCSVLTAIDLPASVTVIEDRAFYDTPSLLSVTIRGQPVIASNAFDYSAFLNYCPVPANSSSYVCNVCGDAVGAIISPGHVVVDSTETIPAPCIAFTEAAEVTITATSIPAGAWANSPFLVAVTLTAAVTQVGAGAFYNCTNLASLQILGTNTVFADADIFGGAPPLMDTCPLVTSNTIYNCSSIHTCYQHKILQARPADGDYTLVHKDSAGSVGSLAVFCYQMNTDTPLTYITLLDGTNVAEWVWGNVSIETTFHRVRLDVATMRLITGDCKYRQQHCICSCTVCNSVFAC